MKNFQSSQSMQSMPRDSCSKLRMVDLFAGTGAFTLGFQQTGKVECVFANDMEPSSQKIYDENFSHKLTLQDLNTIDVKDIPSHDILTGGFPCQPFSVAGKQEGFEDKRSNVFWKVLDIIEYHQPCVVVLENVKHLKTHDDGKTFSIIHSSLSKLGYSIHTKVLNTSEMTGIPQHRERIYIVCFLDKTIADTFSLDFPKLPKLPLSSMLQQTSHPTDENIPKKYYYHDGMKVWPVISNSVVKENVIYQYRRVYVRENKSNECPTLTANMGTGGHNVPLLNDGKGIRKLTPRECFNFQGFPSSYRLPTTLSDSRLYKLAGNAVSFPVVQTIAYRIVALLC